MQGLLRNVIKSNESLTRPTKTIKTTFYQEKILIQTRIDSRQFALLMDESKTNYVKENLTKIMRKFHACSRAQHTSIYSPFLIKKISNHDTMEKLVTGFHIKFNQKIYGSRYKNTHS